MRSAETGAAMPKLRGGLHVREQCGRDGVAYIVRAEPGARMFRLRAPEYFIARQLDGATSLDEIRSRVEAQSAASVTMDSLQGFIARLGQLGLLEGQGAAPPVIGGGRRIAGDAFYLRFKTFDPSPAIEWLLPRVQPCFSRGFVLASLALAAWAAVATAWNWPLLQDELARMAQWHALAYVWFWFLLTMVAHEFAHALTCRQFGGQVREMGVMLIYLQPAFYCNVSDAWLIAEKARRIWVALAGPWLDMVLWALATLVWRISDADGWLHFTALVVMLSTAARTLINLNPLIKLDGYYLLSDAVELPNLRARAFGYLGGLWRGRAPHAGARERRIFVAYGLLAGIYSVLLLGTAVAWLGGHLVERFQGSGFVLLVGVLIMLFKQPLRRALHRTPERLRSGWRDAWAWMGQRRHITLSVALGTIGLVPLGLTISGDFTALPAAIDLRAEVDGVVEEVFVREGDQVAAEQLIARLSVRDRRAALAQEEATIREKQARLKMLRAGPTAEDIALARQRLASAHARVAEARMRYAEERQLHGARLAAAQAGAAKAAEQLAFARQKLDKYQELQALGFISLLAFQEVRIDAETRSMGAEEARAGLDYVRAQRQAERRQGIALAEGQEAETRRELQRLMAGTRPEETEAAEAEIASHEARRANLLDQIERAAIRTPRMGVVTTRRIEEKVGQHVEKGWLVAEVRDVRRIGAEIAVPERDIADVKLGQPVLVKARAYPGMTFRGTVTGIAPAAAVSDRPSAARVIRVTTEIENRDGLLKPEMTGYAKIEAGERPLISQLGRNLVRALSVEVWSWW